MISEQIIPTLVCYVLCSHQFQFWPFWQPQAGPEGPEQYFPAGADPIPENRLFSQFHSPQTAAMKEQILKELGHSCSKLRVVFATIAMGMGVDIPAIRNIIHIGPPRTVREYMQETGRAGRDGSSSRVSLFYNNRDIGKNKKGINEDISLLPFGTIMHEKIPFGLFRCRT